MNTLLLGGTGLISTGIVTHLLARGAAVTMLNRGQRESTLPSGVRAIVGDRNDAATLARVANETRYDVVIDMICFAPDQAVKTIEAFDKRCAQLIFCSTVCTYGVKVPPGVLVDESFPQEPISDYGRNKLACERLFLDAHRTGKFAATVIRPSCTYGPGNALIDNLEFDPPTWDRMEKGLPVLCAGDGLGLWQATHRDDVGKLFAYSALNTKTYGECYNATRDEVFTWRDYYHQAAEALGTTPRLLFMPADWIVAHDPQRFVGLQEIFRYHGAYTSAKAKHDVPEFKCEIGFVEGVRQTLTDVRRRGKWKSAEGDKRMAEMVRIATALQRSPAVAGQG
ncbi:MAG TPA: NAD-dependent epimerase/dehydratase family protein [Tepidisphaeraceae bacterium]|nr:NAD-dependent epimerase/dehydratase family protein [Tepidisphaeraceae bacterium]